MALMTIGELKSLQDALRVTLNKAFMYVKCFVQCLAQSTWCSKMRALPDIFNSTRFLVLT